MSKLPSTIFKYHSPTLQTLQNIVWQGIYFASPLDFNDPYDCAIMTDIKEPTNEELETMKESWLNNDKLTENFTAKQLEEIRAVSAISFKDRLLEGAKDTLEIARKNFFRFRGAACFSEKNDDIIMWSHYADSHRGICLEFRTEFPPFSGPDQTIKKVKYVKEMPKIDVVPLFTDDTDSQLNNMFCTKWKSWKYEQEWRAINISAGTLFQYDTKALKAIYFGADVDEIYLDTISLVASALNPEVEFWKGRRDTNGFRIEFERFDFSGIKRKKYEPMEGVRNRLKSFLDF